MRNRCGNPRHPSYPNYGGRGITVCDRWLASFEAFLQDLGPRPSSRHSLDRIDNDGNYEPGNCRWATTSLQNRNSRQNVRISYLGRTLTLCEWSALLGIPRHTLENRIARKYPPEMLLFRGQLPSHAPAWKALREQLLRHPPALPA
jgi:hypothetical protein